MLTGSLSKREANDWCSLWRVMTALALGLLVAAPVKADWQRDYSRGKIAFEKGEFAEAKALMQAVIAENPNPEARVRLTSRQFGAYLPQLYLGLSQAELGDCESAIRELNRPNLIAVTKGLSDEERLRLAADQRCDQRLAATAPPKPDVTPPPPVPDTPKDSDPWIEEKPKIRALLASYLAGNLQTNGIPNVSSFASPRSQQWVLIIRALSQARNSVSANSSGGLSAAKSDLNQAAALGTMPDWRVLASPKISALLN